jgi:hypothetical protein
MKKIILTVVFSISIIMCYSQDKSIVKRVSSNKKFIIYETTHTKLCIERKYLDKQEITDFAILVENGIQSLIDYFDNKQPYDIENKKITFILKSGKFISNANDNIISLSQAKEKLSPYLHELVHVFLKNKYDLIWLSEGLAVYISTLLSENYCFPNYEKSLDDLTKKIASMDDMEEVFSLDSKYGHPNAYSGECCHPVRFYPATSNFFTFLQSGIQ